MAIVGIYRIYPHDFKHMKCPDIKKEKERKVKYLMTNLGEYVPFDLFESEFLFFK